MPGHTDRQQRVLHREHCFVVRIKLLNEPSLQRPKRRNSTISCTNRSLFITATTIGTAVTTKKTVFGVMVHRDCALLVPSPQSEEFMDASL
jgi:hypothetical protein